MKEKPIQILLRGNNVKIFNDLKKYYEDEFSIDFNRTDIVKIALNKLHKEKIEKSGR